MNNNFLPYQIKKTNDTNEALATQLAEKASQNDLQGRGINVMFPPSPLVATVGDGVADDTQAIQNAINSLSNGGKVFIPKGTYKITATIVLTSYVTLELDSGAKLQITSDVNGVQLARNSILKGGRITTTLSSYTHSLVYIPSSINAGIAYHITGIKDLNIQGQGSGNGVFLEGVIPATGTYALDGITANEISIAGMGVGIKIYCPPSATTTWTNGNLFANIQITSCHTDIDIENCGSNIFNGLQLQPISSVEQVGINLVNATLNQFSGQIWDAQVYPANSALKADSLSQQNFFSVGIDKINGTYVTDNAPGNVYVSKNGLVSQWIVLENITSLPTANASRRGMLAVIYGSGSTPDAVYACLMNSSGTYSWVQISGTPSSNLLSYNTLTALQTSYQGGSTQPAWVSSEDALYYYPSPTTLASDSFNRADNASTLGSTDSYNGGTNKTWTVYQPAAGTATYGITGNQAYASTTYSNPDNYFAGMDIGQSNVTVSVTFSAIVTTPILVMRATSYSNYISLQYTSSKYIMFAYNGSTWTQLGSGGIPQPGDIIQVTLNGSSISVSQNGNQIFTATSTFNQNATIFGINGYNNTGNKFDNFNISGLSSWSKLIGQNYLSVGNVASLPTASSSYRGQILYVQGNGTTTADTAYMCVMSATGTYSWKQIIAG